MKPLKAKIKKKEYNRPCHYRSSLLPTDLKGFQVTVKETDLYIQAAQCLHETAYNSILHHRFQLEQYIARRPEFFTALLPLPEDESAPPIARAMMEASRPARVGPMAAVAGAMAEAVGRDLLADSPEAIVENGGDIYCHCQRELKIGIFAGKSPLSFHIGLRLPAADHDWGVCTSSGTVGPSLSFGHADAVCVLAHSAPLADAAATSIGNLIVTPNDIPRGLENAQTIPGLSGVVIIIQEKIGAWGEVELIEM